MQTPSIGRIVLYVFTKDDASILNRRASEEDRPGNYAVEGNVRPMLVCRVRPGEVYGGRASVSGQVFIDGEGSLWKTSVRPCADKTPGSWHWPEIAPPLSARLESSAAPVGQGTQIDGQGLSPRLDSISRIDGELSALPQRRRADTRLYSLLSMP